MEYHRAAGHPPIPCTRDQPGGCIICERIDPVNPRYSEGFRRKFHPEEFGEPEPTVPRPEGPSLLRKATNLGRSIVTHVAAGMPIADDATVESRWATCRACEMFDAANVVCRACGCRLAVKIRMGSERCPIGKW